VLVAESDGSRNVIFNQLRTPKGMYFPDLSTPILVIQGEPVSTVLLVGFMSENELVNWFTSQSLSRGWLYKGEKVSDDGTKEMLFKTEGRHDWFTLIATGSSTLIDSPLPDGMSAAVVAMTLIDVRD